MNRRLRLLWTVALVSSISPALAQMNGFDLRDPLVPAEAIIAGGPPKDGIPALDEPKFVAARDAAFLAQKDQVLGVVRNGIAKAYPLRVLNWHEVVNDRFGTEPIVVTYCPLCGSGMVFRAEVPGTAMPGPLTFGVSGLLYNSDVLLYDRQTESLWSQIAAKAVTGKMKGNVLESVPVVHTSWSDWRRRHPRTLVLSLDTGHNRDYGRDPYAGYELSEQLIFPVQFRSEGFHPKERVLGVSLGGAAKAYPFVELGKRAGTADGATSFDDEVGGQRVRIGFDRSHQVAEAFDESGQPMAATTLFWFAWYAFNPTTQVYRISQELRER
jgi:hypothetical protein